MTSNSFRNFLEKSSKIILEMFKIIQKLSKIILEMFKIIQKLSKVPKICKEKKIRFLIAWAPFGV